MPLPIHAVLVPQGTEYQAVRRGLRRIAPQPRVFPIPVGPEPLARFLTRWRKSNHRQQSVIVMGLCGSLTPRYRVGDVVIYHSCLYKTSMADKLLQNCDFELTHRMAKILGHAAQVRALTSDRLVHLAAQKQQLGEEYGAEVVDMEGFVALKLLTDAGVAVGMVRVVSDDWNHDLPDLNRAIGSEGKLQAFPLAVGLLRQPVAAARLIRGSLQGLQRLQHVTTQLFTDSVN